jgi:3',5'-cyclic AMP phosphodiesterase CpdA
MYTLMQISDLHAGPPFNRQVAEMVARQAHDLRPDLLVIAGDFVQRAIFRGQWRIISDYIKTLPQPQLVVPGNHDVPLFDGFSRLFDPLRYYARYISREVNPVFEQPGLVVVGGNSAHGLTIDGGYVNRKQRDTLEQIFSRYGPDTCKVLVMHHPLVDPPGGSRKSKMNNAKTVMHLLERLGVDLYLCGHIHYSYVDLIASRHHDVPDAMATERRGIIISQTGTTTSRRGRGNDRAKNSFNIIEIGEQNICIRPYFYKIDQGRFEPIAERVFERHSAAPGTRTAEDSG